LVYQTSGSCRCCCHPLPPLPPPLVLPPPLLLVLPPLLLVLPPLLGCC
jgi:hypothetical protein